MKKCVFIANCQQGPIKHLLRSVDAFNRLYEIIDIPPVHQWSGEEVNYFPNVYKDADIIFSQPIFDSKFGVVATSQLVEFNKNAKGIPHIPFSRCRLYWLLSILDQNTHTDRQVFCP